MNRAEIYDLPNVPDEIWGEIFLRLPVDDRKSVRLCCRRFYDICNCDRILRGERIVFEGSFNFEPAISSLSSSNRRMWNIELRRVRFDGSHQVGELFFRRQGPKVRSLTFKKCAKGHTESNIVESFITSCPYLREIRFVFDTSKYSYRFYLHFKDGLKILNTLGVVRGTVETFTLKVPKGLTCASMFRLTVGDFLRIFDIFPNIKNLRLSIGVDAYFDQLVTQLVEADVDSQAITFSCIRNQLLKMRHQLVKLHLRFMNGNFMERLPAISWLQIGDMEAPNLIELSLNCICFWENSVIAFPPLKHLTHFDCVLPCSELLHLNFVLMLLNAATELRTLKVRSAHEFWMSAECFRAFARSRLATLSFYSHPHTYCYSSRPNLLTTVCCDFLDASLDPSITPNCTLRRLKMNQSSSQAWYLFSRYFTNLENFVSVDFQPQTLLRLFESLPKLSHLMLCCENGFEISQQEHCDSLSHRQLDNLTYLNVTENTSVVSEFLLGKFTFPKLKLLEIRQVGSDGKFNLNALLLSIKKLSLLEKLSIRCSAQSSVQQWLDLVDALPKLRLLAMSDFDSQVWSEEQYHYFLQASPSLRLICIIKSDVEVLYGKDILKNSVEKQVKPRK